MRRGLIGVLLLALLVVPASAGAVQGYKAECQTAFCGGVSEDGLRAVFQPLVAGDEDQAVDVYLRVGGSTELVSIGPLGDSADIGAELLSISGDGQTIAFATREQLTDEDTDNKMDFYLRRVGQLSRPGSASTSAKRRKRRTVLISAESIAPRMQISRQAKLLRSGDVVIHLGCPKAEKSGPCHGRVKLAKARHGKTIGSAAFRIAPGKRKRIQVSLRSSLPMSAPAALFARVRGIDRLGNSSTALRRVALAVR